MIRKKDSGIKNILVINVNPSRERATLTSALVDAYANGATKAGYKIDQITLAELVFNPILHEGYNADQALDA